MRTAVISDVHGNLHALEAVLADIDAAGVDEIWCLGDTVGYGPRPLECCALVAARCSISLVGNHDLGAIGGLSLDEFSHDAAVAAGWTRERLTEEARDFLGSLSGSVVLETVALAHGSPRDPVWEYILAWDQAEDAFARTGRARVLVGHTHVPMAFTRAGAERLQARVAHAGTEIQLRAEDTALLNPGSVGQPRDGDPRAAWLLLDLATGSASFRRTAYPIERTQEEIGAAGLPATLASRLSDGV